MRAGQMATSALEARYAVPLGWLTAAMVRQEARTVIEQRAGKKRGGS